MEPTSETGGPRGRALTAALCAGLAAALVAAVLPDPGPGFLLGGIQVNEPDHPAWLDALRAEGFGTVATTVYAKQGDWDDDDLWWEDDEPYVLAEIRAAKRAGMRVVLIPRVALDHAFERNVFLWHGMILGRDRETLDAWFDRYRTFVLKWARVARDEGVDLYAVGSELSGLTTTRPPGELPPLARWYLDDDAQSRRRAAMLAFEDELQSRHLVVRGRDEFASLAAFLDAERAAQADWARRTTFGGGDDAIPRIDARALRLDRRWRALIDDVRALYPGPLTYAANFDHVHEVGFWDALDVVGINAYWSLRDDDGDAAADDVPLGDRLEAGWSRILDQVDAVRREFGRPSMPVVFTELGYTWRRNGTVQPWAGDGFWLRDDLDDPELYVWGDEPLDLDERAAAIRALGRALAARTGPPLLRGILWWKLTTDPGHREIEPFVAVLGDPGERALFGALRDVARLPGGPRLPAPPRAGAGGALQGGVSLGGSENDHP